MPDQIDEGVKGARNQDLLGIINGSVHRTNEKLVGTRVEVLCEGPSKTNPTRLMGRTRTNKIVVFPPSVAAATYGVAGEGGDELVGELVDIRIERANGFSLYGTPVARASRASKGGHVRPP